MAFDPDKYLGSSKGFDPDEYLGSGKSFDPDQYLASEPSIYSPEGLAKLRQDTVQSEARARQLREEADAELARTKYRVGFKPYGMDEPLVSAEIPASVAAFGSEMVKGLAPTGAGAAAASASMPYATAAANALRLVPGVGRFAAPVVQYGVPVVAGGASAMLTRMGEDVVLPEILPEDLARSYQTGAQAAAESPTAALLGQMAGTAPFYRPGLPINTTGGARMAVPAVTGAIGGGIEGAQQLAEGEFDPTRLAIATAGSALLNRETALGQRIAPNLVLPNARTGAAPTELIPVGQTLREPILPAPTDIVPAELAAVRQAEAISGAEQAASRAEGERAVARLDETIDAKKVRQLGERMMGKSPEQQLAILDQELKLQKDYLNPAEQRAGLDMKLELERKIDAQKAMEQAATDAQKAQAAQQKALAEAQQAAQPPQPAPAEPFLQPKPKSMANEAAELASTSKKNDNVTLQGELNSITGTTPPPIEPVAAGRPPVTTDPAVIAADRVEYDSLQNQMRELGFEKAGTPEFNAIWQKSEDIKNRHGGMPPQPQGEPIRAIQEPSPTTLPIRQQPEGGQGVRQADAPEQVIAREADTLNPVREEALPEPLSEADFLRQQATEGAPPLGRPEGATRAASLRRGQRGAIPASVLAPIGGAGAGATTGFLSTEQRPGETDEQFQARRMKATLFGAAIGAGSGTLAGGAISRGVKARQASQPQPKGVRVDLPEVGPGEGVRQTAAKVVLNQSYPEQLRRTLAEDPEIIYNKISRKQYGDMVASASDAELQQMLTSGDPLLRISAQAEVGSRLAVTPGMEEEGARVIAEFSKNFTSPAQILGLAGLIRSPKAMVQAVKDTLRQSVGEGKPLPKMTPAVEKQLFELASENIRAEKRFAKAERAARKDFNPATRDEFKAAESALGGAKKKLADYTKDILPETYGQIISKLIKGNLLAPLSFAKNMFGNAAWQTLLRGSESVATAFDAVYSGTMGKPRAMALGNPLPGKEELGAMADGLWIAGKEMLTGPSAESYVKAEVARGFHPLRAMLQAVEGIAPVSGLMESQGIASLPRNEAGKIKINDRAKKLIEATLGIPAEASFRFLNVGDKPVRYAVQQRILTEQANLKGLKGVEREKFMLLPDPETKLLMESESMGGILAQDNPAAKKVGRFMDEWMVDISESMGQGRPEWLKDANKVLGTLVIPYRQFPANFAITAANFALPPVGMARAWAQAAKGNQREALRNMGEATIGFMLMTAAGYLWDKGLISEPADPKDKKRRSAQYETMGAQRLNISGLERLQAGGDPTYRRGDHTIDWSSMGPAAASLYALTKMKSHDQFDAARVGGPAKERADFEAFLNVMDVAGFAFDQSFLAGTSAALEAFKDWENYGDRFMQNMFRAITSTVAPNSLEAFNRTQYKFIPEQRGDTTGETLKNVWDYKTGQLDERERVNYKRDFWGKPILRTPEGQNPIFSQFFDVTKGERKAPDPFKQSLLELYQQTRSTDVYPSLVNRYLTNNGVTVELIDDDYDLLQDLVGQKREEFGRIITAHPNFASPELIPETKIEALQKAWTRGNEWGKGTLMRSEGFMARYPELFGIIPPAGHKSRVVRRDLEARGNLRMRQEAARATPTSP